MQRQILVLGGSRFIGCHLLTALGGRALGTYNSVGFPGGIHFDARTHLIDSLINPSDGFTHAVILMGYSHPDVCAQDPQASQLLNVDSIKWQLDILKHLHIKPIFTSSDYVFSGHKGQYCETDTPDPLLTYGRQKHEIEQYIQSNFSDYTIFRLSKVYGLDPLDRTLFSGWLDLLAQPRVIKCAADQVFTPVYVGDVVAAIKFAIDSNLSGLFHIGGPETYSRLALLNILIEAVNEHIDIQARVESCCINDFNLLEPRPLDTSLIADRYRIATGSAMLAPTGACRKLVQKIGVASI